MHDAGYKIQDAGYNPLSPFVKGELKGGIMHLAS